MNRAIPLMLVLATLVLSGCAKQPPVFGTLDSGFGLAKGERLAVVLSAHQKCDMGGSCDNELTASLERTFAGCLTDEIDRNAVLRASAIRDTAFPGQKFIATPRTLPEWQAQLERAEFRQAIEPLNLRYVAFATVNSRRSDAGSDFKLGTQTFFLINAIGQAWNSSTAFHVEVLDMKAGRSAGSLRSKKDDQGFVVLGMILIVPVIVLPVWTRTESLACAAVATELANLVKPKN